MCLTTQLFSHRYFYSFSMILTYGDRATPSRTTPPPRHNAFLLPYVGRIGSGGVRVSASLQNNCYRILSYAAEKRVLQPGGFVLPAVRCSVVCTCTM